VAHARAWWLVALIAVPAVLAGIALLWVERPPPDPAGSAAGLGVPAERVSARGSIG
jgi:hypothetical protein